MGDGPGGPLDRGDRGHLGSGHGVILVGRGEARLGQPLDAVAGRQQPAGVVERGRREGADGQAVGFGASHRRWYGPQSR